MAVFKMKQDDEWKRNYILEFNDMRDNYEYKLQLKDVEIEKLKSEILRLRDSKNTLKPRDKQISDRDIQLIKDLRVCKLSYSEISKRTKWSKATVSRVLNGLYD
ncbi:DNA-binding protein [Romboutsia sp. 1001216sp1]|uniref:DNA-binding protein n=1 Tax=unclassified Romboutsia TaxID=2626894 RepID=UPI0018978646|nr:MULTISPECIES: DNA-binding protein [unclassified Romboutsia]MDB8789197.1 DNA-binding protein [Romboutsia sp. 1001216sp1]MDB8802227.1 DNA-binding protein [Romboutsia sp. 1001216sp1]MDB8813624.1 DNA-binding protein [Romboutsia sp. 1001216sp1]